MADGILRRIEDRNREIKLLTRKTTELKKKKKEDQLRLVEWMKKKGLTEYNGHTITSLEPKKRTPRKKIDEKRREGISILSNVGAPNPELLWEQIQMTL